MPAFFTDDSTLDMNSQNDSRRQTFFQISRAIFLFFPSLTFFLGGYAALLRSSSVARYSFTLFRESTYYLLAIGGSSFNCLRKYNCSDVDRTRIIQNHSFHYFMTIKSLLLRTDTVFLNILSYRPVKIISS
jgi:hypothetical protein